MHRSLVALAGLASLSTPAPLLAKETNQRQLTWFQMFFLPPGDMVGTLIIWTLLFMSGVSVALMLKFFLKYRRAMLVPQSTRDEIESLIAEKKYRDAIDYANNDPSYLGRVTGGALNEAANGYGAMERAIEEIGDQETTQYLRPVEYLNVMGNIAPMLGLFGTVYGMIVAFQALVASGGKPDPVDLAGGISTALVTTFWGLVVAIPALAAYALIRNKIDALTSEGMVVAEELISPFKPGGKRTPSSAAGGSSKGTPGGSSRPRATPKPE
jgi:biopolymer transport protein ExbB